MNRRLFYPVLCVLILGCLPSFHPFCTEEMKVSVPEIDGTWKVVSVGGEQPGQRSPWVFSGKDATVCDDEGRKGQLEVAYFRIDGTLYVDSIAGKPQEWANAEWLCHTLAFHDLCKIELKGDKAEIWGFDYDVFKKGLKDKSIDLPYVERDDLILFTATPEQWGAFLKQNGKDARFYQETPLYVLERVKTQG